MTTSVHHPRHYALMEVGSVFAFGALTLALIGMFATMLQSCSWVMVNLPHR